MTNSVVSSKCLPSVLSSGNYGMSQNRYTDESKEYIFVKLTDSAFRAVEEYQRNRSAKCLPNGQFAKIQFLDNSGVIHFPTPGNAEGRKFGFAIDDNEGSLECIQQNQNELDVLGSLSYRMRIHANDDVYDTTRTKMAIAEETEKSKCIREIKPNQTDIGRKVKKPVSAYNAHQHSGPILNSNAGSGVSRNKLISPPLNVSTGNSVSLRAGGGVVSSRSPNPSMLGGSGTVNNRYGNNISSNTASIINNNSSISPLNSATSLSSTLTGGITNAYASISSQSPSDSVLGKTKLGNDSPYLLGSNSHGPCLSQKHSFSNNSKGLNGPAGSSSKLPDISRRKIRERLIHLLALRPFKKPELYSRLQNEGLRDRERSLISNILKDISTLSRDNTYNLRRQMWNDVNENWPYYTEQELQQLKRRKPQNLTPPLSSDAGSSTSGQSPTSTHTGSPPPLVSSRGNDGLKRTSLEYDRYEDNLLGVVQSKKQRISHFKKDGNISSMGYGYSSNGNNVSNNLVQKSKTKNCLPQSISNGPIFEESSGNLDLSYNVLDNVDKIISRVEQNSSYGSTLTPQNIRQCSEIDKKNQSLDKSNSRAISGSLLSNNLYDHDSQDQTISIRESNICKSSSASPANINQMLEQKINKINRRNSSKSKEQQHSSEFTLQQQPRCNKNTKTFSPTLRQSKPFEETNSFNSNFNAGDVKSNSQSLTNQTANAYTPGQVDRYQLNKEELLKESTLQNAPSLSTDIVSSYSVAVPVPSSKALCYDFSAYTPITSIEQRRRYKTEFENDFDEYRKLLTQIEGVGKRFRGLAERLENVRQGCPDYNNIKHQILAEYQRIQNEETLKRDKQRFDYLHEKLAYIKQLVADYDKTLTSGTRNAVSSQHQYQLEQHLQHQNQVCDTEASNERNEFLPVAYSLPTDTVNINSLSSSTDQKSDLFMQSKSHGQSKFAMQIHNPEKRDLNIAYQMTENYANVRNETGINTDDSSDDSNSEDNDDDENADHDSHNSDIDGDDNNHYSKYII